MEEFKDPRKTFGEALVEAGRKNNRIVALSADLLPALRLARARRELEKKLRHFLKVENV